MACWELIRDVGAKIHESVKEKDQNYIAINCYFLERKKLTDITSQFPLPVS